MQQQDEKTEDICEAEKFLFSILNAVEELTVENLEEKTQVLKQLIENDPPLKFSILLRHIFYPFNYANNDTIKLYANLISKVLVALDQTISNNVLKTILKNKILGTAPKFRYTKVLLAHLINYGVFSADEVEDFLRILSRRLFFKNLNLLNIISMSSFIVICSDYLKKTNPTMYTWLISTLQSDIGYFPSPQAKSIATELKTFIDTGREEPYKFYTIFLNDDVDQIPDNLDPETEFFPSIFDVSEIAVCPSLISAAAYFHANKCVKKLFDLGFSPQYTDQNTKNMAFYAGFAGNYKAMEIVGMSAVDRTIFLQSCIKSHKIYELKNMFSKEELIQQIDLIVAFNCFHLFKELVSDIDINKRDEADDLLQHIASRFGACECFLYISQQKGFDIDALTFSEMSVVDLLVKNIKTTMLSIVMKHFKPKIDIEKINTLIPPHQQMLGNNVRRILNIPTNKDRDELSEEEENQNEEEHFHADES